MTTELTLDGVQQLTQTLHAAATGIADTAVLNAQIGADVLGVAVIPKGSTGRLQAGATVEADPIGFAVYSTAAYFGFVHWGTATVTARPFFTDALDAQADLAATTYLDHATGVLDTIQGA